MKNMFFIISKEKVYAYVVSILTIVILFFMSTVMKSDLSKMVDSSEIIEKNQNSNAYNTLNKNIFDKNALVSNDNMVE